MSSTWKRPLLQTTCFQPPPKTPALKRPRLTCPNPACPNLACPTPACPNLACPTPACPTPACPIPACPNLACPILACPTPACPIPACPNPAPSVPDLLSKTYDLSLHVFVSGFFLQDMLRIFTQNLLPMISKQGFFMENTGHDRVMRIISSFLHCEWNKCNIPLLNTNVSLTSCDGVSGAYNPPQPQPQAGNSAKKNANHEAQVIKQELNKTSTLFASSLTFADDCGTDSSNKNQFPGVEMKKTENGSGRDQETQTIPSMVKIELFEQSVQTDFLTAFADRKGVDCRASCKDCSVQVVASSIGGADPSLLPQTQSSDNSEHNNSELKASVQTFGDRVMKRPPSERVPVLHRSHSSQHASNNLIQLTGIQNEDEPGPNGIPRTYPELNGANGCHPLGYFQLSQMNKGITEKPTAGKTTQFGNTFPARGTAHSGNNLPSEDITQLAGFPVSGSHIPLRITSDSVEDQAVHRECSPQQILVQNTHSVLNSANNIDCNANMVVGRLNPPSSNLQGTPQFQTNHPVRCGLSQPANIPMQTQAISTVLPRNGPCPPNLSRMPRPCSPSLNWMTARQFPPRQPVPNQQSMSSLPVRHSNQGQGTIVRQQAPLLHGNAVQPIIKQSLRPPDHASNSHVQTGRNLIQLTGDQLNGAAQRTDIQVGAPFIKKPEEAMRTVATAPHHDLADSSKAAVYSSVNAQRKSSEPNIAATMGNLPERGPSRPVALLGNHFEESGTRLILVPKSGSPATTEFQSPSSAVNVRLLPGLEESDENPFFPKNPVNGCGSLFSDPGSALTQSTVSQTPEVTLKQADSNASQHRNYGMNGVTDNLASGDQSTTDLCVSTPSLEGSRTSSEDIVSRFTSEQTQSIDILKQMQHEQMDTVSQQLCLHKPTSAHMPPLDEIPLPDEEAPGSLPHSHTLKENGRSDKRTLVDSDTRGSSLQPAQCDDGNNLMLSEQMDTKSVSAQQKTSNAQSFSGHVQFLHEIPLPDDKVQHSPTRSPVRNKKDEEQLNTNTKPGTDEGVKASDPQLKNNTVTPVASKQLNAREKGQISEEVHTERGHLRTIVDNIQMLVGKLSEGQVSPRKSPSQGNASPGTSQAQESTSTSTSFSSSDSQEEASSEGRCSSLHGNSPSARPLPSQKDNRQTCTVLQKPSLGPTGSLRYMPYGVRNKINGPADSTQNKNIQTVLEALIMHDIPMLMGSHSNLSAEAIQEKCSRLITRYSHKLLERDERRCHKAASTPPVKMKDKWTLTKKPRRANRRIMTDEVHTRESGTVTNIGRRETTTLTDSCWMKDAWTVTRRLRPHISRSAQTGLLGVAEVGTATETRPRPVTTDQGMVTDRTEHDKETTTAALVVAATATATATATQPAHHFPADQLDTSHKKTQLDGEPLEQCRALARNVPECVTEENVDDTVEELGKVPQPPGDEGTVRITIKVKIGKGSNIRMAS
ncbi:hypothetical protein ACOMHN_040369 [Nucella lapillus]